MPAKAKATKAKSRTSSAKKKTAKKLLKKKALKKKVLTRKSIKKKTASKKTTIRKTSRKTTSVFIGSKEQITIEPGPPGLMVPPVEEPARNEEAIGTVTHYYSHLSVAIVQINKGIIMTGDTIRLLGHTTDFTQRIESMEYEHQHVDQATPGQNIGLKVIDQVREHDILYKVK